MHLFVESNPYLSFANIGKDTLKLGLIGALTSRRVLLLSPDLVVLSSYRYAYPADYTEPEFEPYLEREALSMLFMGPCLLYVTAGGGVHYLPASAERVVNRLSLGALQPDSFTEAFSHSAMEALTASSSCRLASIPLETLANGALQLLAATPDRIVLAFSDISLAFNSMSTSVVSRPVIPIEPLLVSLCTAASSSDAGKTALLGSVLFVLKRYCSDRAQTGGVKPSSHITATLLKTIMRVVETAAVSSQSDDPGRVALLTGLQTIFDSTQDSFPKYRWLPTGAPLAALASALSLTSVDAVQTLSAAKTKQSKQPKSGDASTGDRDFCAALLANHRPELVEVICDPQSAGLSSPPSVRSALALQAASFARELLALGAVEKARILADFAGDDPLLLAVMLTECLIYPTDGTEFAIDINQVSTRKADFSALLDLLTVDERGHEASPSDLTRLLSSLLRHVDTADKVEEVELKRDITALLVSITDSTGHVESSPTTYVYGACELHKRRQPLQQLLSGPLRSTAPLKPSQSSSAVLAPTDRKPLESSALSEALAMDSLEDLLFARFFPDALAASEGGGAFNKPGGGVQQSVSKAVDIKRPVTYVENIGLGKEWERIVGYWRFSDAVTVESPNDLFVSTGLPAARLCFPDLSKVILFFQLAYTPTLPYACLPQFGRSALELFSLSDGAVSVQPSSSPCDPGEGEFRSSDNIYTPYSSYSPFPCCGCM